MKIIADNISIVQSGYMNGNADLEGTSDAADELQRLMCYREVVGYYLSCITYCPEDKFSGWESDVIDGFIKFYPESMILEAIEKVKNEQK